MLKSINQAAFAHLGTALVLCSSFLLTACQADDQADYVDPQASAFYERYPIKVAEAPSKLGVAAHSETLTAEQVNAVMNFASDARNTASSNITIKWPSGSAKLRQAAMEVAQLMSDQGVPEALIRATPYPGGASAPIQISFQRKVAVTKECGDWSENLASTPRNDQYTNYGCAFQHNVAAMVADPEDFERPRPMSPIVAAHRTAAMAIYYQSPTVVTSTTTSGSSVNNTTTVSGSGSGG
jgi:pilus assembly protein CpaD